WCDGSEMGWLWLRQICEGGGGRCDSSDMEVMWGVWWRGADVEVLDRAPLMCG
ncbi:hypothetical protein A2U01_0086496, partial [Trifolium medium]|nr:hypothetical protein [Trifolium medium]